MVVLYPFHELERACSHRITSEILTELLPSGRGDDIPGPTRDDRKEWSKWCFQLDGDGLGVIGRDFLNVGELTAPRRRVRFIQNPVKIPLDGFGIARRAVMEHNSLTQAERIDGAI